MQSTSDRRGSRTHAHTNTRTTVCNLFQTCLYIVLCIAAASLRPRRAKLCVRHGVEYDGNVFHEALNVPERRVHVVCRSPHGPFPNGAALHSSAFGALQPVQTIIENPIHETAMFDSVRVPLQRGQATLTNVT
jgi:hypothetical protein